MTTPTGDPDYVDLNFLGRPGIIATAIIRGPDGVALVDPGPSTTLPALRVGLRANGVELEQVRQVLLTHIHLDHAGGTGTLVKDHPAIEVFVHERGAPHLIDPSRLLASAGRLYGADMERLWGDFLAVPAGRVHALEGGERIVAGGRELDVAYTPGHASHHVSYFDRSARLAYVGDTAGIRRDGGAYVMPPTPPPDIDLEAWRLSAERILEWKPETLFLTHFGPFQGAQRHLGELMERLKTWSAIVRRLLADPSLDEPQRERQFVEEVLAELRPLVGESEAGNYSRAGRIDYSWQGLSRYWKRRTQAGKTDGAHG